MSTTRLDALRKIRREVSIERDKLTKELAKLDEIIAMYQGSAAKKGVATSEIKTDDASIKRPSGSLSSPGVMQRAIALALEMYDKKPRFVTTGEVLKGMIGEGLILGGKSPSGNVSSYLKHTPELTNFKGHGWVRTRDVSRWKQVLASKTVLKI